MTKSKSKTEVEVEESPRIEVGETKVDPAFLLGELDDIQRKEKERELRQRAAAQEIGRIRWNTARFAHRLADGVTKLDFESHPFQVDIFKDDSMDLVIYGSSQWGKSEMLVVDLAVSAAYGFKVLMVTSKREKQFKFVSDRLDPCFRTVDMYRHAMESASARNATADSMSLKHFGPGSINLVAANSASNFTSYTADKTIIDEHQECDIDNIKMVDDRMSGSWFGAIIRVGHPTTAGTEQNQNLDYLYKTSDARVWKVPCSHCKKFQVLTWLGHIVIETAQKGGLAESRPRDQEWKPGGKFDIRPICEECHRPIDRLSNQGAWEAQQPGMRRRGYKLSNICNSNVRLDKMLERYRSARHSANAMQEFWNKQLGEPWDMDGSKINEHMLALCASGGNGVKPYRFIPAFNMIWKKDEVAA